ncbi:MAG: carbohydrate kinase [Thermoguttaceae bacterium]|nr:carbohydrate kinase [Thermoguttaceae bacterium]
MRDPLGARNPLRALESMVFETSPLVVGLGELLWDVFGDSRRPGGAPANVAFQASQLGCRGVVCSRVGSDALGDELIDFLVRQGLSTEWIQRDPSRPTGTVTVDTSRPDHPTYVIHEDVAWDGLEFDASWEELMSRASAICFGTLAQRSPQARQTIQRCLGVARPGCLVVYDVNLRQHWYDRSRVGLSLAASRVVKLNADEVQVLDRLFGFDSPDEIAFARALQRRFAVETVCITRAERGAVLISRDEVVDQPGVPVKVVDAVGAGDAFTAALIVAQLRGWPPVSQASFANAVGAMVAGRPGAMPVLRDEYARLMAGYP